VLKVAVRTDNINKSYRL